MFVLHAESDIQTITPKTKVSPSQLYRHQPRSQCTTDSESDVQPPTYNNRNNHAVGDDSEADSENGPLFNQTLRRSFEMAPSSSDLSDIERKLDMWSRQMNSNIMASIYLYV